MESREWYTGPLKRAVENKAYMRMRYKRLNGWQVDYSGKISAFHEGEEPFVMLPNSEDPVYVKNIITLVPFGKADYPY